MMCCLLVGGDGCRLWVSIIDEGSIVLSLLKELDSETWRDGGLPTSSGGGGVFELQ